MKSRKTYEKTCVVCGKKYISHSALAMYCPPCRQKVLIQQTKDSAKRIRAREEVKAQIETKKKTELRDIVMEAEKLHLTYGQYVAMSEGGGAYDISGL